MMYDIKELMPIAALLADVDYDSSNEDGSFLDEKTNDLMKAVVYCINEGDCNVMVAGGKSPLEDVYYSGYEAVINKVMRAQDLYNELTLSFNCYYNKNYRNVVMNSLPNFFLYYDAKYAPYDNVIDMEYPVFATLKDYSGINVIERYIKCIDLEQMFMSNFMEIYVIDVLQRFDKEYTQKKYNICRVLLRNILACMLINKNPMKNAEKKDYSQLRDVILYNTPVQIKRLLRKNLQDLIIVRYGRNKDLFDYLVLDVNSFVNDLINAVDYQCIEEVVVL